MIRCINDMWTYCKDEDKWNKEINKIKENNPEIKAVSSALLKCSLCKDVCGFNYKEQSVIDPRLGTGAKEKPNELIQRQTEKEVKKVKPKKIIIEQGNFF